ncbi:hypothetical protein [Amycolatopsis sp. H20-H5]|uniref:hypothetical protein n=1 Tax=Amycolatopsis sp. H20-H5 TaxID=3046309 RepID=UPI002DB80493|nr:hypothetical protein [Amycolatopsis sp. H20-H5]MEC3977184.1 hypothetical protein [Amycolatopsis sp. H20-H5]
MTHAYGQVNPWLTDVGFTIAGDSPPAPPGSPGSFAANIFPTQGFILDRGEAEAMVEKVDNIIRDLEDLRGQAGILKKVTPPAEDPASVAYNAGLVSTDSGAMYAFDCGADHIEVEIQYLTELSNRLNAALGRTVTQNHEAAVDISKAGQGSVETGAAG